MTESQYRLLLATACEKYVKAAKEEAGKLVIDRYMQMTLDEKDSIEDFFNDVLHIVSAYALEVSLTANR